MTTISDTEVIVVGAGAVGCSIAYHLAVRGVAVTVLDAEVLGAGTTAANLGLVWVQGKEPAPYMEYNMASAALHQELASKFDEDVGWRQSGGLSLCLDDHELETAVAAMNRLRAASSKYAARALSPAEVRVLEPYASPNIAGATYSPHDGHINPIKFVINLARLAERHGARFVSHTPVRQILRGGEGVTGVETSESVIRAKKVVVAAGKGAPALVQPLGFELPLDLVQGQLLVTARMKQMINHPGDNVRQTLEGNILLGTTKEHHCDDLSTTGLAARKIANIAIRSFPILKEIPVIRHFAGVRPMPVDGKPYLGPAESVPGLYVAVSHSGITLAPIHGKVISELIIDGRTDVPIGMYRPERYAEGWPQQPVAGGGVRNEQLEQR